MSEVVEGLAAWPAHYNISEMNYHPQFGPENASRTYTLGWKHADGKRNTHIEQIYKKAKKEETKVSHVQLSKWTDDLANPLFHGSVFKGQFHKNGKRQTFIDLTISDHKKYKWPCPGQYEHSSFGSLSKHRSID